MEYLHTVSPLSNHLANMFTILQMHLGLLCLNRITPSPADNPFHHPLVHKSAALQRPFFRLVKIYGTQIYGAAQNKQASHPIWLLHSNSNARAVSKPTIDRDRFGWEFGGPQPAMTRHSCICARACVSNPDCWTSCGHRSDDLLGLSRRRVGCRLKSGWLGGSCRC